MSEGRGEKLGGRQKTINKASPRNVHRGGGVGGEREEVVII